MDASVRALLFDVFGTCVDWRTTVTHALHDSCQKCLSSPNHTLSPDLQSQCQKMTLEDWGRFAQEWRNTYKAFTRSYGGKKDIPFKNIDEHHFDSLNDLISKHGIQGLWSEEEIRTLSLIWHKLTPWKDSVAGMAALNTRFETATLSNGNVSLLEDLRSSSGIEFKSLFSGEMFGAYKPHPSVYLGAAAKLGLLPSECAMAACHLNDLQAAHQLGFRAVYVERSREEDWNEAEVEEARKAGWVDVWVTVEEDGFLAAAEKMGIET
ncbi:haloacid dehalogenase [Aulographum hederae CBS 113979]|uniref:Haloacid dehalogenase n=1 Tax=Aulographum hederae CBS 113979 TaxID=1176131 RepID=A0A6G1GU90_9PEZI|nr:haloacid dehalogenase [Aulographum hederae CBS 113979]